MDFIKDIVFYNPDKDYGENNKKYKASIELSDELPFKKGGDKLDISYASKEDITIINKIN